ncbi:MAG: 3-deoxy-manno-octulosonate cytidylyltransferase [Syntrophothermus sp.]
MKITGIIPARFGSSRFPGKPLADIFGKPMIQRVYEQASQCSLLTSVVVATDDEKIFSTVKIFGGEAVMTSPDHASGTERCLEAADLLGETTDVIINIQGDEPFIDPDQIRQVADIFSQDDVNIATLKKKIRTTTEIFNPNVVKVVTGSNGNALYFSRQPIPYLRGVAVEEWAEIHDFFKHIGIYGYRTETLKRLVKLPVSPPEKAESLEQLRWLWHGFSIRVGTTEVESIAVDTPDDLLKITNRNGEKGPE